MVDQRREGEAVRNTTIRKLANEACKLSRGSISGASAGSPMAYEATIVAKMNQLVRLTYQRAAREVKKVRVYDPSSEPPVTLSGHEALNKAANRLRQEGRRH
jgi:hypothetical protein